MDESVTPQGDQVERWLPVVGWEGLYDVSDLGRVRSLPRQTQRGVRGGKVLKPALTSNGRYLFVTLSRNSKTTPWLIHRLVAAAFIGPCPDGHEVCHGPGGSRDNRAGELSYGTRAQNMADCLRDGTRIHGERVWISKLTADQVSEIRARFAKGERQCDLCRAFDMSSGAIAAIVHGRSWTTASN